MITKADIKWRLLDHPLKKGYYWLDVLEPIIKLEAAGRQSVKKRKAEARELAKLAVQSAGEICKNHKVTSVRIRREIYSSTLKTIKVVNTVFNLKEY